MDQHLGQWTELSNKIGGDVALVAPLALACVHAQKALIAEASKSKVRRMRGFSLRFVFFFAWDAF